MNRIIEVIVEPAKILAGSRFMLKVRVNRLQSLNLILEDNTILCAENNEELITEGDYYEEKSV